MVKKEGGYKVPDDKKKQCHYCSRLISKQGWNMHMNMKHKGEEFVSFDEAKGGKGQKAKAKASGDSGDTSFREREEGNTEGNNREKKEDNDGWGDFFDDE